MCWFLLREKPPELPAPELQWRELYMTSLNLSLGGSEQQFPPSSHARCPGVVGVQRLWCQKTDEISPCCLFLTDAVTQRAFMSARTGESHWQVTSLVLLYHRERCWACRGGRKRARLISPGSTVKKTLNATAETLLTRVEDRQTPTSLMESLCSEYLASFRWLTTGGQLYLGHTKKYGHEFATTTLGGFLLMFYVQHST